MIDGLPVRGHMAIGQSIQAELALSTTPGRLADPLSELLVSEKPPERSRYQLRTQGLHY